MILELAKCLDHSEGGSILIILWKGWKKEKGKLSLHVRRRGVEKHRHVDLILQFEKKKKKLSNKAKEIYVPFVTLIPILACQFHDGHITFSLKPFCI